MTLHLVEVDDARAFGCVPTDATGRVTRFSRRRPSRSPTRSTPAATSSGAPSSTRSRAGRVVSVERETFPGLLVRRRAGAGLRRRRVLARPRHAGGLRAGSRDLVLGVVRSSAVPGPPGESLRPAGCRRRRRRRGRRRHRRRCRRPRRCGCRRRGSVLQAGAVVGADAASSLRRGSGARVGERTVVEDAVVGDGAVVGADSEIARGHPGLGRRRAARPVGPHVRRRRGLSRDRTAADRSAGAARTWSPGRPVDLRATARTAAPRRRRPDASGSTPARSVAHGAYAGRARRPSACGSSTATSTCAAWGPARPGCSTRCRSCSGRRDEGADAFATRRTRCCATGGAATRAGGCRGRNLVIESLVPAVLEQKVTGGRRGGSWRRLVRDVRRAGARVRRRPACGWCPSRRRGALVPSWEWHRAGVGPDRSRTIVTAAARAAALERTLAVDHAEADRRLRSLPGIGAWTSAEVRQRAHGDPDAVSVGDFHLAGQVVYALTGSDRRRRRRDARAARAVRRPPLPRRADDRAVRGGAAAPRSALRPPRPPHPLTA